MSVKETYHLAHTAQCKLRMAVNAPDRNWRFIVGHAVHLDSLMLRIVEIEDGIETSPQASQVKFKGAGGVKTADHKPQHQSPLAQKQGRSPPPPAKDDSDPDEEDDAGVDEEEDLGLMRFPSGSARPPQPPPLDPSDGDSSSSDEDEELSDMLENLDPEVLRSVTSGKADEELARRYNSVQKCPCHKSDAPPVENMWELPNEKGGVRTAVIEIRA